MYKQLCAISSRNSNALVNQNHTPGTEFKEGNGGGVSPNFWTEGDILSFVPPIFCDKK